MATENNHRIQQALNYIEEHLLDELSPELLACQAGYSVYHFCRIFHLQVGISPMEYVRKRRLTFAAQALAHSDQRIIDIALDHHYESQEAFTRSFKRAYGLTPGAYRRRGTFQALIDPAQENFATIQQDYWSVGEPAITRLEAFLCLGVEYVGDNSQHGIIATWVERFLPRAHLVSKSTDTPWICGVNAYHYVTGIYHYLAGCQVTEIPILPQGMIARLLPATQYAVFTVNGSLLDDPFVKACYANILDVWLPQSGYQHGDSPEIELSTAPWLLTDEMNATTRFCIPVQTVTAY